MILGITHIGITVSNLQESIRYYREVLALTVLSDAERKGEWIERVTGIPGFHTRTVYMSVTPHLHLELFQFYHPRPVPREAETGFQAGMARCNYPESRDRMSQDPDGLWMRGGASCVLYPTFLVRDLDASIRYYRDILGLEITDRKEGPISEMLPEKKGFSGKGASILFSTLSGLCLELVQPLDMEVHASHPWIMQRIGFSHVAFAAEDMDQCYAQLTARGVAFKSPPQSLTVGPHGGGKVVYLTAPEGFTLELIDSPRTREWTWR